MTKRNELAVLIAFVLFSAITACAPTTSPSASSQLRVVATTTQVAALAKVVGGDYIALNGLLPIGVDPHEYELTPADLRALADAQVIIKNGLGFEKPFDQPIANLGGKVLVVDTSTGAAIRKGDEQEPQGDTHIWHSIPNAIVMLNNIRDGLIKADPAHADAYRTNAAAYEDKLNELDQYIKQQIATIPPANRKLVTNHDAFGYYLDRYGLTLVGSVIPSMDTSYEPSAKELADLVRQIKAQQVKAVFTEASINSALAKQIAQEAGVRVVEGGLYGDTLGPPGSGAETLDGMLKHNTDVIVSNLK
ncbi:MAG: zinc ABC transporter substrate-binding protein [Chloroflexi bacterium]|nr:zinc ABC transporter substrate-binding protein [Chloroflexota bacterium]